MSEVAPTLSHDSAQDRSGKIDPITAEVFRQALIAIPGQIDANIVRSAYSPLVYEYKDYAVGVVDAQGRLLSQAPGALPIFVANALGVAARDALSLYGHDGFAPDDIVITNHSGTLGQHLNNVVMLTPIFVRSREVDSVELFGFMAVIMHWIDVGGQQFGAQPKSIFEEGTQYRCLKLMRGGDMDPGALETVLANTRFREALHGDIQSQIAGCRRGAALIRELVEKYGAETSRIAVARMWERAELGARAAIRELRDGIYEAHGLLDDDGNFGGPPVRLAVKVAVAGEIMQIDFSGCDDQVFGQINSGREGGAVAAARIAFKFLIEPREPVNDGVFRPLDVVVRDGTVVSANGEAAMAFYSQPLPMLIDLILRALAPACEECVSAGHHGAYGVHGFRGFHPQNGARFECFDTALGGWGATSHHDGIGPFKTMAHGDTLDVPVEVQEALYPIRTLSYSIRTDSGGAGKHRGGNGLTRVYEVTAPCTAFVVQDRNTTPPWGVSGGHDGQAPRTELHRAQQPAQVLTRALVELMPRDRLVASSGGGGGYGDPLERDGRLVERDLEKSYISIQTARDVYGYGKYI